MDNAYLSELGKKHVQDEMRYRWFGFKIPTLVGHIISVIIGVLLLILVISMISMYKNHDNKDNLGSDLMTTIVDKLSNEEEEVDDDSESVDDEAF